MERRWVIVAFADILGFTIWAARADVPPEIRDPFMDEFSLEMEKFVNENNFHIKYLGDGLMFLAEIAFQDEKVPFEFMESIKVFTKKIRLLIKKCSYPQPDGFRARIVSGYVDKRYLTDPNDRTKKVPEYVGHAINLAQRLLEIKPETAFICHESVLKILGEKRNSFRFKKLDDVKEKPRGVNQVDIESLWTIRF